MSNPFRREFWEGLAKEAWIGLGNPAPTKTDQNYDSFRHAYTSAFWAFNFGEDIARQGGDYIERSNPKNFDGTERMLRDMRGDLLNNAKGREIGLTHPGGSQPSLAERVRDALNSGELVIDKQTDSRTLSTNFPLNLYPLSGGGGGPEGDPFTGMPWPGDGWGDGFGDAEKTTSPLVLDLNGDGVSTTRLSNSFTQGVHFNLDATGLAENTGWVSQDDGLLVRDLDADGKITTGRELFGNHTVLNNGRNAANGFEALAELDDTGDGVVNTNDASFASLKVWKDSDSNGLTDTGELLTLAQAGVKSFSVAYTGSDTTDANGNQHRQLGSFTRADDSTQSMDDVWFSVDTARTKDTDTLTVNDEITELPDFANIGNQRTFLKQRVKYRNLIFCINFPKT